MNSNFEVKLALTLPLDLWGYRPQSVERIEQLSRYADLVFERQNEVMEQFSRGWLAEMVSADNRAREEAGLPQYLVHKSPVKAYVELVNGNDKLFTELVRRINQQFGEEAGEEFLRVSIERVAANSNDRIRNAPPREFTDAMFRLDDIATYDLPLYTE